MEVAVELLIEPLVAELGDSLALGDNGVALDVLIAEWSEA